MGHVKVLGIQELTRGVIFLRVYFFLACVSLILLTHRSHMSVAEEKIKNSNVRSKSRTQDVELQKSIAQPTELKQCYVRTEDIMF
jgi:hypothetical protein